MNLLYGLIAAGVVVGGAYFLLRGSPAMESAPTGTPPPSANSEREEIRVIDAATRIAQNSVQVARSIREYAEEGRRLEDMRATADSK